MAVVQIAVATGAATTLTATFGATTTAGNIVVAFVSSDTTVNAAGFTLRGSNVANQGAYVWDLTVGTGATSYSVQPTTADKAALILVELSGVTAFDIISTATSTQNGSTRNQSSRTITTLTTAAGAGDTVLAAAELHSFGGVAPTSPTWDNGFTAVGSSGPSGTGGIDAIVFVASATIAASTAVGTTTNSWTTAVGDTTGWHVAYKNASGGAKTADTAQTVTVTQTAVGSNASNIAAPQTATVTQTAVVTKAMLAAAPQTGAATLTATATRGVNADSPQTATVTQTATAAKATTGGVALTGTVTLTATATVTHAGAAAPLTATVTLTATASVLTSARPNYSTLYTGKTVNPTQTDTGQTVNYFGVPVNAGVTAQMIGGYQTIAGYSGTTPQALYVQGTAPGQVTWMAADFFWASAPGSTNGGAVGLICWDKYLSALNGTVSSRCHLTFNRAGWQYLTINQGVQTVEASGVYASLLPLDTVCHATVTLVKDTATILLPDGTTAPPVVSARIAAIGGQIIANQEVYLNNPTTDFIPLYQRFDASAAYLPIGVAGGTTTGGVAASSSAAVTTTASTTAAVTVT